MNIATAGFTALIGIRANVRFRSGAARLGLQKIVVHSLTNDSVGPLGDIATELEGLPLSQEAARSQRRKAPKDSWISNLPPLFRPHKFVVRTQANPTKVPESGPHGAESLAKPFPPSD